VLVHEHLSGSAAAAPDKVALECGARHWTYAELFRAAQGLSGRLVAEGVRPGDRVFVFLPNSVETVVSIFAASMAGACFVVGDPNAVPARITQQIGHCGASVLITAKARLAKLTADASVDVSTLLVDDAEGEASSFWTACAGPAPELAPAVDQGQAAAIIYTSGSTGEPKGATLSHRNIGVVSGSVARYLAQTPDDVVLSVLQLSFGYGLLQLLVTFRTGGTLVLETGPGFPFDLATKLSKRGVTGFAGVPTLFGLLLQLEQLGSLDFSRLRYITNAAAAMPRAFVPRLRAAFPTASIFLMYGQTECLRSSFLPPEEIDTRPESIGKGLAEMEVWLELDGHPVREGEAGELIVGGENVMLGYWNDPERTAEIVSVLPDGRRRLHTGDLFRRDAEGWLYFVGRRDDIIKCRGEKVAPMEIEHILLERSDIAETRVIGVPDDVMGHRIRAEIVLREGRAVTPVELKAFLKPRLEAHKMPHDFVFVAELPKSASGKILRR
jgi:long-chain acyl-CoA synthetase